MEALHDRTELLGFAEARLDLRTARQVVPTRDLVNVGFGEAEVRVVPFSQDGADAWFPRLVPEEEGLGRCFSDETLRWAIVDVQEYTGTKLLPGENPWAYLHDFQEYADAMSGKVEEAMLQGRKDDEPLEPAPPSFSDWRRVEEKRTQDRRIEREPRQGADKAASHSALPMAPAPGEDLLQEGLRLIADFRAGDRDYPQLRHRVFWHPPGLPALVERRPTTVAIVAKVLAADLVTTQEFLFDAPVPRAQEGMARFENLAKRALTWAMRVRPTLTSEVPEARREPELWMRLLYSQLPFSVNFYRNSRMKQGLLDWEWLRRQPAVEEKTYVRHIRLDKPVVVKINGHQNKGIILKPE
jgi:hypothetical protein